MPLDIVCWNVRNLSATIDRPGVRGRGLLLDYRIDAVAANINQSNADIVFLLEMGPDVVDVRGKLARHVKRGYTIYNSDITYKESYIMVIRDEYVPAVKSRTMVGTLPGYRQAWHIKLQPAGFDQVNLVVLHAPSPGHSLAAVRLPVLENVIMQAQGASDGKPILFMGDLNIKAEEFPQLLALMTHHGFTFGGPGTTAALVSTSIRKFTTILKGQGHADPGSQPYDQFWTHGGIQSNPQELSGLVVGPLVSKNLVDYVTSGLEESVAKVPESGVGLRGMVTFGQRDELYILFDFFRSIELVFKTFGGRIRLERKTLPVAEWLHYIDQINTAIRGEEGLIPNITSLDTVGAADIQVATHVYNRAKRILGDFTFWQGLAYTLASIAEVREKTGQLSRTALFEHGISDHRPIRILIALVVLLPAVVADPMDAMVGIEELDDDEPADDGPADDDMEVVPATS